MTARFVRAPQALRCGPFVGLLAACLALACGDNQDDEGAQQLLSRVQAENYRSWERPPGWEARRASNAPHGDEVDIYVNDRVAEAMAAVNLPSWPEGSTIVKDGWDGSELELIAIMDKRSDGWYWAEYDSEGDPTYSGHPETCTDCHAHGSDFVRAFSLP